MRHSHIFPEETFLCSVTALLVIVCLCFLILSIVTEERFVTSLEIIAKRIGLSPDVAGATLIGAAANTPELVSSFIATFITHSALGLGTVLGSIIGNEMLITASAVFAAKDRILQLDPLLLTRECGFCVLSLLLLLYAVSEDKYTKNGTERIHVTFHSSSVLASAYIFYVLIMVNFQKIKRCFKTTDSIGDTDSPYDNMEIDRFYEPSETSSLLHNDRTEERPLPSVPKNNSLLSKFLHVVLLPLKALINLTIPSIDSHGEASWKDLILSCVACIIWLVVVCYYMVAALETLGDLIGISDIVMGVTLAAVGTSVPNIVAANISARNGQGDVAIGNAFGSNIFIVMVGLGLPWAIYTGTGHYYDDLIDDNTQGHILVMIATTATYYVMLLKSDFCLRAWHAAAFILMYMGWLVWTVMSIDFDARAAKLLAMKHMKE
mmetsp:Transcript_49271/g.96386  ORF Transcript_49271/g.96386 Transcript_49271/m.96386 type:complete len:435 (+) Transcript_49271:148-1452(+)|eukprot:CAMPEP_0194335752 /NCGR_PEP_ID=MMETSP0171-20130528/70620_1 /TAXON_ID=218684 /ORGANISM="Corethron pennatum, Strain L29A3" /LENGTH=434 /DNA_ID=CAMNT_0039098961 /DNA_START=70 /DNA_END=1374 /DNA_ORIENTATION=-